MRVNPVMRSCVGAAAWLVLMSPSPAPAADTQVELSVGSGIGSAFTKPTPFTFDGTTFPGPFRLCPDGASDNQCLTFGNGDTTYALDANYPVLGLVGLDVRQPLPGPFAVDVGVLGGIASRERRVLRTTTPEVDRTRALEPDDVFLAWQRNSTSRTEGVSSFAYVHAGLRLVHEVGARRTAGSHTFVKRLFVEAGGGWVPLVPGGADAGLGRPPAVHGAGGITFRSGVRGEISLTARYIRALASTDDTELIASRKSWITVQVGWASGH